MKIKNFKLNSDDQVIVKITGEVLRAFHLEVANEYEPIDFENFEIVNSLKKNTLTTQLTVQTHNKKSFFTAQDVINPAEKRSAEIHRIIKKNLYRILTDNLNLAGVPYGIMHGVRPTKIVHRWIREGFGVTSHGVIDKDRLARRLRTDYLTDYNKSHLLTEVAVRQIPILNSGDEKTVGVYVGIPFCVSRCLYCSFPSNVLPDEDKIAEFMSALTIDINAAAEEIQNYGFKVQSIYIGGGTPTALPSKFFVDMMNKVRAAFYTPSVEEFTVECGRPDTISPDKIFVLKSCKVTRVSVNPQTMQQKTLDRIGRQHSIGQVYTAYNLLRKVGNFKINMDLILGLPGENLDDVKDSLEKVLVLNPEDITLHALAIKRGSQLQAQLADEVSTIKDFELPEDEEVRRMAELAEKMLREKKYLPYYLYRQGYISGQIENVGYCKPGAEGIYNVQIMDERQTILGVGAAATTKVPDNENLRLQTSFNAKDLTTYLRDVDKYIENRKNTLAEIYNPSVKAKRAEEIFDSVEETDVAGKSEVAEKKRTWKFERRRRRSVPSRFNQTNEVEDGEEVQNVAENVEPVAEVQPAEEITQPAENAEPVEENVNPVEEAEPVETVDKTWKFERRRRRHLSPKFNKADEVETVAEVLPVTETVEEIATPAETVEAAVEVELPENIHATTNTLDMSGEEVFNEFLDEVAEKPAEEDFAPKTDEEIFDNFLEEVVESSDEISHVVKDLPEAENADEVYHVQKDLPESENADEISHVVKDLPEAENADEVYHVQKDLPEVENSDEVYHVQKDLPEVENADEVYHVQKDLPEVENSDEVYHVQKDLPEVENSDEVYHVQKDLPEVENSDEVYHVQKDLPEVENSDEVYHVQKDLPEVENSDEVYHVQKDLPEVENSDEVYHVQKDLPEVENADEVYHVQKDLPEVENADEVYHVQKDLPEVENPDEIYHVQKALPEIDNPDEIYQVPTDAEIKSATAIKTVDGIKTVDEIKSGNAIQTADEVDEVDAPDDRPIAPRRPKFRHKRRFK